MNNQNNKPGVYDTLMAAVGLNKPGQTVSSSNLENQEADPATLAMDVVLDSFDLQTTKTASSAATGGIPSTQVSHDAVISPLACMIGSLMSRAFLEWDIPPQQVVFDGNGVAPAFSNASTVTMRPPVGAIGFFIIVHRKDMQLGQATVQINNGGYNTGFNLKEDKMFAVIPTCAIAQKIVITHNTLPNQQSGIESVVSKTPVANKFIVFEPIEGNVANPEDDSVHPYQDWIFSGVNVSIQATPIFPVGRIGNLIQAASAADELDELAAILLDAYKHI